MNSTFEKKFLLIFFTTDRFFPKTHEKFKGPYKEKNLDEVCCNYGGGARIWTADTPGMNRML